MGLVIKGLIHVESFVVSVISTSSLDASFVVNLRFQVQRPCRSPRGYVACGAWR